MTKTKVRIRPNKAMIDKAQIYQIIDRQPIGHIGFIEDGLSYVIPMNIHRFDDILYWHSSTGNRIYNIAKQGGCSVSITFTLVHGLIASSSPANYSTNYSCAMVFGTATAVLDQEEKKELLVKLVHKYTPKAPFQAKDIVLHKENPAICKVKIEEFSGKQSLQDSTSLQENQWLLPIKKQYGEPIASHANKNKTVPSYIQDIVKQPLY